MRKIAFAVALVFLGLSSAKAQSSITMTVPAADDTLTNADTAILSGQLTGDYSLTFAIKGQRISGTAAGSVALYGSTDGANFVLLDTSNVLVPFQASTLTNVATQVLYYYVPTCPFRYYRVRFITSGTVSLKPTAQIYYKSRQ